MMNNKKGIAFVALLIPVGILFFVLFALYGISQFVGLGGCSLFDLPCITASITLALGIVILIAMGVALIVGYLILRMMGNEQNVRWLFAFVIILGITIATVVLPDPFPLFEELWLPFVTLLVGVKTFSGGDQGKIGGI